MSWRQRVVDLIAPKAKQAGGFMEETAERTKERVVLAVQGRTGLSAKAVLCLLMLILLLLGVGGYGIYWRYFRLVKPPAALVPVQTQGGGGPVYQGNQVPAMAKAEQKGKAKPRATTRPVEAVAAEDLPPEEQAKLPAIPPAAGPDNVIRKVELLKTAVVPPWRGETHVRANIYPDGKVEISQDPQRERFFGLEWKHLEFEGGYGTGGKQFDGQATWLPLRMGNVHVGARAEGWTEVDGTIRGAGSIRVRWEPFRSEYR